MSATQEQTGSEPTARHSKARRPAVGLLVLGMHRSGTSALTGVLGTLGVTLAGELLGAERYNEKGLFENKSVNLFHEKLLARLHSSWDDPLPLSREWLTSPGAQEPTAEAVAIARREFQGVPLFAVKDPRMCRFVPLWLTVLERVNVRPTPILCMRHPLEVAGSLRSRDGYPKAKSLLLWLTHTLDAERDTRHLRRSIVFYDDLMANWRGVVQAISADLDLAWPTDLTRIAHEIDGFVSKDLRHHVRDDGTGVQAESDVEALCFEAFAAMRALQGDSTSAEVQARLDDIRARFEAAITFLGPYVAWSHQTIRSTSAELGRATWLEAELRKAMSDRDLEMATKQAELERQVAEQQAELERQLAEQRAELERQLAEQRAELERQLAEQRAELERQLAEKDHETKSALSELSAKRRADVAQLHAQLSQVRAELRLAELRASKADQTVEQTNATLRALSARLEAARGTLHDARRRGAALAAELTRERARAAQALSREQARWQEAADRERTNAEQLLSHERTRAEEALREATTAHQALTTAQYERGLVEHSWAWRAVQPAHRVTIALPPPLRRNARRAVKLVWWLLTPHRIPQRLKGRSNDRSR